MTAVLSNAITIKLKQIIPLKKRDPRFFLGEGKQSHENRKENNFFDEGERMFSRTCASHAVIDSKA